MLRSFGLGLATAALALAAPAVAQQQQQQQETVRATYGAWQIRCVDGSGACVMAQVGKGPQGNDVIEMRVRKLQGVSVEGGEQVPAAVQILTPLGVLLPAGVRIQIDAGETRAAPYEICGQVGCVVRQAMSDELLDQMRGGMTATITMVAAPENEVTAELSLNGFTRAFSELNP